jgi:hypothetical protein
MQLKLIALSRRQWLSAYDNRQSRYHSIFIKLTLIEIKEQAVRRGKSKVWRPVTLSFHLFSSWLLEKARKSRELGKERIRKGLNGLGKAREVTVKEKARPSRKGMERRKRRKKQKGTGKERARTPREGMERRGKDRKVGEGIGK